MEINACIGYDHRMPAAYAVAVRSLMKTASCILPISPILITDLIARGDYDRETVRQNGQFFDVISGAPMATEFAISRFFIPYINNYKGWTFFCDSDFMFRADIKELIDQADDKYAVMCVKHDHCPKEATKMDGQLQTLYKRKNWSSMMLINNAHPKNRVLEPKLLNALPGRDLHSFSWLDDEDIGTIDIKWNWLEGHSDGNIDPAVVHYTDGTPDMAGYEDSAYADEWRDWLSQINLIREL